MIVKGILNTLGLSSCLENQLVQFTGRSLKSLTQVNPWQGYNILTFPRINHSLPM